MGGREEGILNVYLFFFRFFFSYPLLGGTVTWFYRGGFVNITEFFCFDARSMLDLRLWVFV